MRNRNAGFWHEDSGYFHLHKLGIVLLTVLILTFFSGCVSYKEATTGTVAPEVTTIPVLTATPTPSPTETALSETPIIHTEQKVQEISTNSQPQSYENKSVAMEVNYRNYVDWFKNYNLYIRAYTPLEYVCGQYTVDMINASEKAGFHAYFADITFKDGAGHAMVAFKSSSPGFTSWYFYEPQNNHLMTPETLSTRLSNAGMGTIKEVTVYGYYDDAGDNDPTSWRFAYPLYDRKY